MVGLLDWFEEEAIYIAFRNVIPTVPTATIGAVLDATYFATGATLLQSAGDVNQPSISPTTQAAGGLVFTLVVGAIMLAAAPNYVDSIVEDIHEEPVASFAWGSSR